MTEDIKDILDGSSARLSRVSRLCSNIYDDCAGYWAENAPYVSDILKDADILEIGCGPFGGLANIVFGYGAKSYLGIDIDREFVESSRRYVPGVEFTCDDPIHILNAMDRPVTCVSSGVIDRCILNDEAYAEYLIKTISSKTRIGGHSIHQAAMLRDEFGHLFERYGFESMRRGRLHSIGAKFNIDFKIDFEAYERVR